MEPDSAGLGAKRAAAVIARIVAALDVLVSAGMAIAAVLNALTTRTSRPSPDLSPFRTSGLTRTPCGC